MKRVITPSPPSSFVVDAIIATAAYCDQFRFPLRESEVWKRLIWPRVDENSSSKALSKQEFHTALAAAVRQGKIVRKLGMLFLPGRAQWVGIRRRRTRVGQAKKAEARRLKNLIGWLPWVRGIFITGSAAMTNAELEDDLDVMMVVQPRRLWLTRLIVTLIAFVVGRRRSWHGEEPRSWCFNLWLDEEHLAVPLSRRSIYIAYEVVQARPLFMRGNIARRFWWQNRWAAEFFPNWRCGCGVMYSPTRTWVGESIWGNLDWLSWRFQEWYMYPHRTSERTARGYAFFHPRNTRGLIETRWKKCLAEILAPRELRRFWSRLQTVTERITSDN